MGYFHGHYYLIDQGYRSWLLVPGDPVIGGYPLTYHANNGQDYAITEAFEFDGATIPRIFWSLPGLDWMAWPKAAAIHDWLWTLRYTGRNPVGFWRSNLILREAIVSLGWSRVLAWIVFVMVTVFGWWFWFRPISRWKKHEQRSTSN